MVQQCIKVFFRIKPSTNDKHEYFSITGKNSIELHSSRNGDDGLVNNRKESYTFNFERIFGLNSKQEEIFENVAIPIIQRVLEGYNGTIFAYGQTGSGKTHTMIGDLDHHKDRGIIIRCIEYFFRHFERNKSKEFSLSVSYLEIYNESAFDLLGRSGTKSEDLEKVTLMEDRDQNIHLKNLSSIQVTNSDEACSLLFNGDLNRQISQTALNVSSTRSHCIFTFHLSSKSEHVTKSSKLHLVDLAGSERVSKTGADGLVLTEAKYINLSLHHLEQVILALSERRRHHVPYRNCFLTSVLRDSLGGNCMTSMIATCSSDETNIEETMSTCRFAQRVSRVCNEAKMNERSNKDSMIEELKVENEMLKMQLGQKNIEIMPLAELTEVESNECKEIIEKFLKDEFHSTDLMDPRKIRKCFMLLKEMVHSKGSSLCKCDRVKQLEDVLKLRDNEIEVLVKELKKMKMKNKPSDPSAPDSSGDRGIFESSSNVSSSLPPLPATSEDNAHFTMLHDKQRSFDDYKAKHKDYLLMKHLKDQLKMLMSDTRMMAKQVTEKRLSIGLREEKMKKQQMLKSTGGLKENEFEELKLISQLENERRCHDLLVESLKNVKLKHDQLDSSIKQLKTIIIEDFGIWWSESFNIK